MTRALRLAIIPIALAGIVLSFSCSDSEHRIPFGATRVVIMMNLPDDKPDAEIGILERIRRFLVPDAIAQMAPATFSSIKVRVTGPDIAMIEKSFAPYSSISMSVPAGSFRNFEVIAYVAPGDPSAAASFRGTASANCPAGSMVSVPVMMSLHETKIIVPDYLNSRLVILDSITGEGVEKYYDDGQGGMMPRDVDFDSRGRMYVVNEHIPYIIRFDNTNFDNPTPLPIPCSFPSAIAVDRSRNLLYVAEEMNLYRSSLDGSDWRIQYQDAIDIYYGIDVAPDGNLVISGFSSALEGENIFKYDPEYTTGEDYGIVVSNANMLIDYPLDITVWKGGVYVANNAGSDGERLLRFPLDFDESSMPEAFGINPPDYEYTTPGYFYGAQKFISLRAGELLIIDEEANSVDRVISIEGFSSPNWKITRDDIGFQFYMGGG